MDTSVRGPMDIDVKALHDSELEVVGRLVDASNATLLCNLAGSNLQVIYKPILGEKPLWDFPDGNLAHREVASYYISQIAGFDLVPLTILRDGPYGVGSVQLWVDVPDECDPVTFGQSRDPQLATMAVFDAVVNNTDRKYGHLLQDANGKLYGCDHGVTLHSESKLRTVLWQFAGEQIPPTLMNQLQRLTSHLDDGYLQTLITDEEIAALYQRISALMETGCFPYPSSDWPAVPWPPF